MPTPTPLANLRKADGFGIGLAHQHVNAVRE
jgi:hypothetical protein